MIQESILKAMAQCPFGLMRAAVGTYLATYLLATRRRRNG